MFGFEKVAVLGLTLSVQSTLFPSSSSSSLSKSLLFTIYSQSAAAIWWGRCIGGGNFSWWLVGWLVGGKRKEAHTERYVESVCVCTHEGPGAQVPSRPVLPVPSSKTDADSFLSGTYTAGSLVDFFFFFYSDPKRSEWYSRRAQGEKKKKEITSFWKLVSFHFLEKKRTKSIHPPFKKIRERERQKITYKLFFVGFGFPFRKRGARTHTHTQTVRK